MVAAVQAGRAGASTLLVEKNGILGGTMTVAGVAFPGLFHAWGRQVIAGIGWDLVSRCVAECGGSLPDFSEAPPRHSHHQVRVNPAIYAALCDEAVLDAGVDLLFHTMVADLERTLSEWRVRLCTKAGLVNVSGKVLIDCTGDANAARLAGARVRHHPEHQPGTLVYQTSGYAVGDLDVAKINACFEEEVRKGNLSPKDVGWDTNRADVARWLKPSGNSANHILATLAENSDGKTQLEVAARRSMLRVYRFLRKQPGLGNLTISYMSPECGVRETVTVVGERTVRAEDYVSGKVWDDSVCYAFYPIDVHLNEGSGLDCRPLSEGTVPTVPLGALRPQGTRNLLVAGRCISSDREANSALRVQATCMGMGQAAGAAGAIAAMEDQEPGSVPIDQIHELLRVHGGIVPELPASQ